MAEQLVVNLQVNVRIILFPQKKYSSDIKLRSVRLTGQGTGLSNQPHGFEPHTDYLGALAEMVLLHPVEAGTIMVRFHEAPPTTGIM
jgi:hypothetical protein